jgi:hypothetical protein
MLRLFTSILKFLLFILALVSGFMVALVVLPLPGKTFFNRMSQLPPSAKDLIDNTIGIGVAIGRLVFNLSKELNQKLREGVTLTRSKIALIREKIAQARKNLASRAREKVKL